MNIIIVDPALFTWPYDCELVSALAANGNKVQLVTKHLAVGEQGKGSPFVHEFFYPGLQRPFFKRLSKPAFLVLKGLLHVVGMIRFLFWVKKEKPDVIHFQWTPLPFVDQFFIRAFRRIAPTLLTVHDSSPFNNNPSSSLQRCASTSIFKRFDSLIAHTEHARQKIASYGVPENRIERIAHGSLEPTTLSATVVTDEDLEKRRPVTLLLFGQLKPYKGADVLIRAFAELPDVLREQCVIHIAGKALMDVAPLRELAQELGVADRVRWNLRFIADEELPDLFSSSDIVVFPYRAIDASGVLMIALSVGRPIIASRLGLFSELIEDGAQGLLVPPDDAVALSKGIARLIEDDALRLSMGRNARVLGAAIPSWKEIAGTTEALYRRVASLRLADDGPVAKR